MSRDVWMRRQLNLPNTITLLRIFLVPVLVVVIVNKFENREWIGVAVFLLAACTDWLDGWVARRRKQITQLGKLLDPMADKLLISGAFISLIDPEVGNVPAWMVVVIIGREFAVTGLRGIAAERGIAMAASPWGKIKMVFQVVTVCVLLLSHPHASEGIVEEYVTPFGWALLWGTVIVTVISGFDYFLKFRRVLDDADSHPAVEPDTP